MKIGRLLFFVGCAGVAGVLLVHTIQTRALSGPIAGHTVPLDEPIPAYTRSLRPNYPYSIIPGGVYSRTELLYADNVDPVVRAHYADFDMKNSKIVQLMDDRLVYASYRIHKQVYWTKNKLRIPKGEVLVTDGNNWARARCGNRLSETPRQPVNGAEPASALLSLPHMKLGFPMELAETPPMGELSAIKPIDPERYPAVVPAPNINTLPVEGPATTVVPVGVPAMFGSPLVSGTAVPGSGLETTPPVAGTPLVTTPPVSSTPGGGTPSTPPILTLPPGSPTPPVVIPPGPPPISPVPEPKVVYLFLVAFVLSLYGLMRIVPTAEKKRDNSERDGK